MKIAFLFGTMHRGGAERVIASISNTFCAWGEDVSIITLDNADSGYDLNEKVNHIKLNLSGSSKNKIQALLRNFRVIQALRHLIKREKYDAVISFELRYAVLLQYAFPFGRKFKIIASERANPNKRHLSATIKKQYEKMLPRVDGFVFQTKRVSECYCEKLREIGTVIHNGVFPEILPPDNTPFEMRNHNDICAVGRLDEQKGFDTLIEAFDIFRKTHNEHRLHIYGEGQLRSQLEKMISEKEIGDRVKLHGSIPNVMFEVAKSGMFVLSSRFEGMPNALMEAMACGLPCVATNCDFGPEELITDGENGLLVNVDDSVELAEAMARISDCPDLAQKLSKNAFMIREDHSGETIAKQYHSYIRKVINQ